VKGSEGERISFSRRAFFFCSLIDWVGKMGARQGERASISEMK